MTNTELQTRTDDELLEVLRAATGVPSLAYTSPPARLTGGFWAELIAFELEGAPPELDRRLVARLMPDAAIAAKESVIQAEVARQGFPTPLVRLAGGPDDGLGRAFLIMDLASGEPLLAGLGGVSALASLPRLARQLPDTLGATMAQLHRVDARAVRQRLEAEGVAVPTIAAVVADLTAAAEALGRHDLQACGQWLIEHPPTDEQVVICHGDLHPFNLLEDGDGAVTVLDWSASILAPPTYDVAFSGLLLAEPPLALPEPLRPILRRAGHALAGRFRRRYESVMGARVDVGSLAWHEGLVCLRALVEVAGWAAAGEVDGRAGHPWVIAGPALASRLTELTGFVAEPMNG